MSDIPVDVIVVAHNSGPLLIDAVRSAVEQTEQGLVWVMDAESSDGSLNSLADHFHEINIRHVPNRGFSASNNRAIEQTHSDYILLLNPDAVLQPGALRTLLRTAAKFPKAAIVAPAIYNPDHTTQDGSYGKFPSFWIYLGLHFRKILHRFRRSGKKLSPVLPEQTESVDWVTGAAMLVRREAVKQAGLMDEHFFLYYEDIEWCHRMRDHGWDILLEPTAQVVHHLGKSEAPSGFVARAYRESFYRYCGLYNLWGLRLVARAALIVRKALGGTE